MQGLKSRRAGIFLGCAMIIGKFSSPHHAQSKREWSRLLNSARLGRALVLRDNHYHLSFTFKLFGLVQSQSSLAPTYTCCLMF